MKILHVHSGNLYGGVETLIATLARARDAAPSMEMSVALCFPGRIAEELRSEGVPIAWLGQVKLRRPDTVWRARQVLSAVLEKNRYDAVVCHQAWPHAIFGPVAKAAGVPLVFWVHMAQTSRHWLDRLARRVQPDLMLCNSRFTMSTLPQTKSRVEIVYYPVLASTRIASSAIRNTLPAKPSDVVIIQVSRLEPLKGHTVCLEALAHLRHKPGWVYWQVGGAQRPAERKYLAQLRADAARLGISDRVHFLGERDDVHELLSGADIFCQPNLQPEAFGISFVEALFAGVPAIGSAIGGVLEIVNDSCGRLVPAGDSTALSSAMCELIENPDARAALGGAGPARARELCDPTVQMRRIETLLAGITTGAHVLQS